MIPALLLCALAVPAIAEDKKPDSDYQETINVFKKAPESKDFFDSYGYAVFPSIGKGGVGVGGAYGQGRVYEKGKWVGNTSMTQATVGFQFGGQVYRQIVFFKDETAFKKFTAGNFEFGAEASAVAITIGAGAKTNTSGSSVGASTTDKSAVNAGAWHHGMATFTVAQGGVMYEATIGGQKFSYKPR
jgi:lipid-binding SYLF domain-containing protein